jgi:hypothetical protein
VFVIDATGRRRPRHERLPRRPLGPSPRAPLGRDERVGTGSRVIRRIHQPSASARPRETPSRRRPAATAPPG